MESFAPLDSCPDANRMIARLLTSLEEDRACLSRELHDEMGGLLGSVIMDIEFAEQHMPLDVRLRQRLTRARGVLSNAIALERKMLETLRPSILDNFGLFEAIKWETKCQCRRAKVECVETYPDTQPAFNAESAISLFRIAQESHRVALRQPGVTTTHMAVDISEEVLNIAVSHDGEQSGAEKLKEDDLFAICFIAHRARSLGGRMTVADIWGGGTSYRASLPLARLVSERMLGATQESDQCPELTDRTTPTGQLL
jgi:two-component system, NarL family, sensor histidine kinase UhpB